MSRTAPRLAAFLAAALAFAPLAVSAAEIGATHLVFEKSAKMKKIDAALFLSYRQDAASQLRCGVMARGKNGPLAVAGSLSLRLQGESTDGAEIWQSAGADVTLDENGDGQFEPGEIAALAAAADAAGAEIRRVRVDFKGGRGGRATEVTVDCLYDRSDG